MREERFMFKLFQINPTEAQYDRVNQLGWTDAMMEMPIIEAAQSVKMGGSKAWNEIYVKHYAHVSNIDTTDAEEAFLWHNNPSGNPVFEEKIERFASQYSMSVGDVIVDESGKALIVDGCGFSEVTGEFV